MNVQVRRAHVDEAPVVAVLVSRLLAELTGEEPDTRALLETTRKLLAAGDVAALLVLVDQRPAGMVTLNQCAAIYAGGRFGEISELYVGPDDRSAGLGRHLIEAAVAHAREAGWTRLEVGAPDLPRWQRSADFYAANGFTLVGPRFERRIGPTTD
jgi:GNAT superfamily N-acetyltransferase